jgi:hypothetical protein
MTEDGIKQSLKNPDSDIVQGNHINWITNQVVSSAWSNH